MLFITGSNGIYAGVDLKAKLPTTKTVNGNSTWDPSQNEFSWTRGTNNLMPIFNDLKGKLNTDYVALKFTTSKNTKDYRICFMNGSEPVTTKTYNFAGKITIKLSELGDLSQVDNIKFGGGLYIENGSITLDPKSIVLVGRQLQNNTQRYDLSTFEEINNSGNVQSAKYDSTNKELVVKTQGAWDNYFPLYKDLNGTNSTGVRVTAKEVKFRILAKTSDEKDNSFQVHVPESNGYVTRHYKWEDFENQKTGAKMTQADVAKITQIGLAGDNGQNETDKVFYVKNFWLDDIADYDKTIPCYGDERGKGDVNSFVYTTDGATAVFENSTTRDDNNNIILNAGKKLTLSSDVSKFTEVCLVFGDKTTYNLTVAGQSYTGTSTALICPVSASELTILNNSEAIYLSKIIYSSEKAGINEERTITVDVDGKGKTRSYWLYVPASLEGIANVPVVFSLHGRGNNDKPYDT